MSEEKMCRGLCADPMIRSRTRPLHGHSRRLHLYLIITILSVWPAPKWYLTAEETGRVGWKRHSQRQRQRRLQRVVVLVPVWREGHRLVQHRWIQRPSDDQGTSWPWSQRHTTGPTYKLATSRYRFFTIYSSAVWSTCRPLDQETEAVITRPWSWRHAVGPTSQSRDVYASWFLLERGPWRSRHWHTPGTKSGQLTITIFYNHLTVKLKAHSSINLTVHMCVVVLMLIRYGTLMFKALADYRNSAGSKPLTVIIRPWS